MADEGRKQFPDAAKILNRHTYVDDCLYSCATVESAVCTAKNLMQLCKLGSFRMTKFTSNRSSFLKEIPEEDSGKNVRDLNLDNDSLVPEKTLGLEWDVETDVFRCRFVGRSAAVTKRNILSVISGIFDPLGIVSPVVLLRRVIMQKLTASSGGWDDEIPSVMNDEWRM